MIWFWIDGDRRRYLKKRIGRMGFYNVYNVARNISYMILNRSINISGSGRIPERGSILYSWHFGVWELMPGALVSDHRRIGIIVNRYQGNIFNRYLDRFLMRWRSNNGVRIFSASDSRNIIDFLKKGGTLGLLVDGNQLDSRLETTKRISQLAGVPMIPFVAYRDNGSACLRINCGLESMIDKRPWDYMWFYKSRA